MLLPILSNLSINIFNGVGFLVNENKDITMESWETKKV